MIYLDHNATSPLHPSAREAMEPWWDAPCNASSIHGLGRAAANAVRHAAAQVAALVGADPSHLVFTSGATEANLMWARGQSTVCVGATEHPSLLRHATQILPVDAQGHVLSFPSGPCSVMAANHETGVINRAPANAHVDASAAAGRMPLDLRSATLSSHKIGGPLGVGALIDPDAPALIDGAQQRGRRGGTLNTPAIVGFGAAAAVALQQREQRCVRWQAQQETLLTRLRSLGATIVGPPELPTVVNAVFPGLPAELLVQALDLEGVCVSAGAACASGSVGPSPVLQAMGLTHAEGVRFSLGWSSTDAEISAALRVLETVLERMAPLRS